MHHITCTHSRTVFEFAVKLDEEYRGCSVNIGQYVYGDLNSRIGPQAPGEEEISGSFTFGRRVVCEVEVPNRDLLMELCQSNSLTIANALVPDTATSKATYAEPGHLFNDAISEQGFNMLEILLCDTASFVNLRTKGRSISETGR